MSDNDLSIEERLKGHIEFVKRKPLEIDLAQLKTKHLVNDLAMDSLDMMNLLLQIDEEESVEITEADLEASNLFRFENLANFIRENAE